MSPVEREVGFEEHGYARHTPLPGMTMMMLEGEEEGEEAHGEAHHRCKQCQLLRRRLEQETHTSARLREGGGVSHLPFSPLPFHSPPSPFHSPPSLFTLPHCPHPSLFTLPHCPPPSLPFSLYPPPLSPPPSLSFSPLFSSCLTYLQTSHLSWNLEVR